MIAVVTDELRWEEAQTQFAAAQSSVVGLGEAGRKSQEAGQPGGGGE